MPLSLASNTAPAPGPAPKWRLSPTHLRSTNCTCMTARHSHSLTTASDFIAYQIDRFDKVWTRITHINCYPKVLQAVERVVRRVRLEGIELCHFAGYETNLEKGKGKNKREFSVLLLVPDMADEKVGHRCVAEIMVHLNKDKRELLDVATRFAIDWEDWTTCRPAGYVDRISTDDGDNGESTGQMGEEQARQVDLNIPDKRSGVSWEMMMDRLELEVKHLSFGAAMSSQAFRFAITRATKELAREGRKVGGFQVQRVDRIASAPSKESENSKRQLVPNIRIACKVLAHGKGKAVYEEEAAAVAFIDLPSPPSVDCKEKGHSRGQDQVRQNQVYAKGVSVVYQGEWPMFHHYKQNVPPPDVSTLLSVVSE